ncbi:MAG TPA: hypothetical protein VFP71_02470 [Candidatus Angelobacter sp.]|nr:hypothetical protein [Candidatus Angelobacter sp.]
MEHAFKRQAAGRSRNSRFRATGYNRQKFSASANLQARKIAIVVMGNGQWPVLKAQVQLVVDAINAAKPGTYTLVEIPAV